MRIKHIDALRGIAALSVTFFHLTGSSGLSKHTASYGIYGFTGVQMFFVISGFILPYSMFKAGYKVNDFGLFSAKRIIRIYPAYFVAVGVGLTLALITGRELLSIKSFISHLFFLNIPFNQPSISPVFWTLYIEFQFYILIGILYSFFSKSYLQSLGFILLILLSSLYLNQQKIITY
ncbi:MAG: acyltransferase, partial [Sphingobacteriaceae bacterium]